MTRLASIQALADDVLATVIREAQEKTASEKPAAPKLIVPTARDLRKLAAELRENPDADDEVTPDDLAALEEDPEVAELLQLLEQNPELLAQLLQNDDAAQAAFNAPEEPEPPVPPVIEEGDEPPPDEKKAAHASLSLRTLAKVLRKQAEHTTPKRIKAAAMLRAATGIQHLVGGPK